MSTLPLKNHFKDQGITKNFTSIFRRGQMSQSFKIFKI